MLLKWALSSDRSFGSQKLVRTSECSCSRCSKSLVDMKKSMRLLAAAAERGINYESVKGIRRGYYAETATIRFFAERYPDLLLLPWEVLRKMGVVVLCNPMDIEYTFFSHQWERSNFPFLEGAQQVVEHIHLIRTKYVWLDWWCVPQWSRDSSWPGGPDPTSLAIFQLTMESFHKLCFLATQSLCIVKRVPIKGVRFGDADLCEPFRRHAQGVERILKHVRKPPAGLDILIDAIELCGVDLEYAVRAWCALERVYLPDSEHADIRLHELSRLLAKLKKRLKDVADEVPRVAFMTSDMQSDAESIAHLFIEVNRVNSIVDFCISCEENRALYQNAWSYKFLKQHVLRISNVSDFKYLDRLFVTREELGKNGMLFLLDEASRATPGRSRSLKWPAGASPFSLLSLLGARLPDEKEYTVPSRCALFKSLSRFSSLAPFTRVAPAPAEMRCCGDLLLADGQAELRHTGTLLVTIVEAQLRKRKIQLRLTNLGVCAAQPKLLEVTLRWRGSIETTSTCTLRVTESRNVVWSDLPSQLRDHAGVKRNSITGSHICLHKRLAGSIPLLTNGLHSPHSPKDSFSRTRSESGGSTASGRRAASRAGTLAPTSFKSKFKGRDSRESTPPRRRGSVRRRPTGDEVNSSASAATSPKHIFSASFARVRSVGVRSAGSSPLASSLPRGQETQLSDNWSDGTPSPKSRLSPQSQGAGKGRGAHSVDGFMLPESMVQGQTPPHVHNVSTSLSTPTGSRACIDMYGKSSHATYRTLV